MDFISLMAYDLHGSWENKTGHNSPLYAHAGEAGDERFLNMVGYMDSFYNKMCVNHTCRSTKILVNDFL